MKTLLEKTYLLVAAGIILIGALSFTGVYLFKTETDKNYAYQAGSEARYNDQADLLQDLYQIQPWQTGLTVQIADAYFHGEDYANAVTWYTRADEASLLNATERLRLGQSLVQTGRMNGAKEIFTELGTRSDLAAENVSTLSQEWRNLGDLEESLSTILDWISAGNQPDEMMTWKAATLQAAVQPEDALSVILRLNAEMPNLREKLYPLIEIFEKINQADSERWFEIGRFLFDNQEWDLAENAFLQFTRLRPGDSEGWAMLGESKLMHEEEGYPDLVKAIRLNEQSRLGRYFLAKYWRERGQTGVATKYLESLAAEEPGESLWKIELAKTAYLGGDTANALAFYKSAAKIDPGNIRVWQALGEFCLVNGIDLKGACEAAVQQSILLGPDDPVSNDLMGWLLLTAGDPDNAFKFLRNSLRKDAGSARSHLHYAQALIGVGDMQSAKTEFTLALSLDAGGPIGLTASRLLQRYFGEE